MAVDSIRQNLPTTATQRTQGVRGAQPVLNAVAKSTNRAGDLAAMRRVFSVSTADAGTGASQQNNTPRGTYLDIIA